MKNNQLHYLMIYLIGTLLIYTSAGASEFGTKGGITDVKIFSHVDGQVKSIIGNMVEIDVKVPEYDTSSLPFTNKITQKLVSKSFLLENSETVIRDQKAVITEIRRDLLTVQFERPPALRVGDQITISVPKKVIAIVDFDVIRGHDKSIGIISLESLTTSIVESGQFNVVERNKLKTVLKELELGASGLTDTRKAGKLGKLLQADIILTGTFADMGGYWNANLRLINANTGLIVSAFEEKASFTEIKPEAVRDTSIDLGDFEADELRGWLIGYQKRDDGGYFTVGRETTTGANNTKSSLRVDYRLGKKRGLAVTNLRSRDWSLYSGIEFYAKSDHDVVINFFLQDENRDTREKTDMWFTQKPITTTWQKSRIGFDELTLSRRPEHQRGGDGVLSLDLIQSFGFSIAPWFNEPGSKGTIWMDEIRLY
jgi:hypothetical protein